MTFRQVVLVTHRWLGLASSMILTIAGLTGAALIWPGPDALHKIAGRLHQELGLHLFGWWVVVVVTGATVLLQLGGAVLWWRRKALAVRTNLGWWRTLSDLHHPIGAIGLLPMILLAISGVAMAFVTPDRFPEFRRVLFDLHTTRGFSAAVKIVYLVCTTAFAVQSVTGIVMWWKPKRSRRP